MKRKIGPLPVWGWALIAGGTIGGVLLWKKAKAAQTPGAEVVPEHLETGVPEVGAGAGGGGEAGKIGGELAAALAGAQRPAEPSSTTGEPIAQFVQDQRELEGAGWRYNAPGATGSSAAATGEARSAGTGGQPKPAAAPFKTQTVNGHTAHVYPHAVPNGTGPGKNVVVLKGPRAKTKTHAAQPSHIPRVRRQFAQRTTGSPHPTKHTTKRPRVRR